MTVTPATVKIVIPASLTVAQQAAVAAANPNVGILVVDFHAATSPATSTDTAAAAAQSDTARHAFHPKEISAIGSVVANVAAGVLTYIPPPFGAIATLVVKWGLPKVEELMSKEPTRERWPIDDLEAMADSVETPTT